MRMLMGCVVLLSAPVMAQTFVAIPELPGGAAMGRGRAISPDGSVVVGVSSGASGDEAVRWVIGAPDAEGLSDLPGGAFSSEAQACSSGGGVVFGWGTNASGNLEAFRWSPSPGMQPLGFLPSGGYSSRVYGCSADGGAACGENLFQPAGSPPPLPITQAFRWTEGGGMQGLGFLPGSSFYSTARAMSADGSVVVGWATDSSFANRPFRWTQAGMVDISGGQFGGTARGVSSDGQWVVGSDSSTGMAYRWHVTQPPGTYTTLLPLIGAGSAAAADVSDDGRVVVGASSGRAVMWEVDSAGPVAAVDLTLYAPAGWGLQVAHAVSNDGRTVAGYGLNPQGQTQGFVMTFPSCDNTVQDYNGDGDYGTDQDIEAFFACLGGNCCPTCHPRGSDVNGDGDYGTDQDIEAFFACLGGNCCV